MAYLTLGPEWILILLDLILVQIMFLVVIDAHSKWIDVQIVNSTLAESTIAKLHTIFATHVLLEQTMDLDSLAHS